MSREFKKFALIWVVMFAVFNAVVFITPAEMGGYSKYAGAFWPAFIFIVISFIGHLICAYIFFKEESVEKRFLNLPLMAVSYTGLAVMTVIGTVCMAFPNLPAWAGAAVCILVLGFSAVSVIKADMNADIVSRVENKAAAETSFIRCITADAQVLLSEAVSTSAKASVKKVYEALRYSDPVSSSALINTEREISEKFSEFSNLIKAGNDGTDLSAELVRIVNERNTKCKALK